MTTTATEERKLRSAKDEPVPAETALQSLMDGNRRFVEGRALQIKASFEDWRDMVEVGESPFAAVLGCAESRCPVEIFFDAKPGDIFVCRNSGNTCTHAEGSTVGSLEFCIGMLRTRFILVLGHTQCMALRCATKVWKDMPRDGPKTALDTLLQGLTGVPEAAAKDLEQDAEPEAIANHAVKVNVMHTVEFLLQFSKPIRDAVRAGVVQVQGAVYHIETGEVEFMGPSPHQQELLESEESMPPALQQHAAAPTAQAVPQTSMAASTTGPPMLPPVTYTTYAAAPGPMMAPPLQYPVHSVPLVRGAPIYLAPGQQLPHFAYPPHMMPVFTTAPPTMAAPLPMTGAQFVTTATGPVVYRHA